MSKFLSQKQVEALNILGISITQQMPAITVIKKAYRKCALKDHPDKVKHPPGADKDEIKKAKEAAEEKFKKIGAANEYLMSFYDENGNLKDGDGVHYSGFTPPKRQPIKIGVELSTDKTYSNAQINPKKYVITFENIVEFNLALGKLDNAAFNAIRFSVLEWPKNIQDPFLAAQVESAIVHHLEKHRNLVTCHVVNKCPLVDPGLFSNPSSLSLKHAMSNNRKEWVKQHEYHIRVEFSGSEWGMPKKTFDIRFKDNKELEEALVRVAPGKDYNTFEFTVKRDGYLDKKTKLKSTFANTITSFVHSNKHITNCDSHSTVYHDICQLFSNQDDKVKLQNTLKYNDVRWQEENPSIAIYWGGFDMDLPQSYQQRHDHTNMDKAQPYKTKRDLIAILNEQIVQAQCNTIYINQSNHGPSFVSQAILNAIKQNPNITKVDFFGDHIPLSLVDQRSLDALLVERKNKFIEDDQKNRVKRKTKPLIKGIWYGLLIGAAAGAAVGIGVLAVSPIGLAVGSAILLTSVGVGSVVGMGLKVAHTRYTNRSINKCQPTFDSQVEINKLSKEAVSAIESGLSAKTSWGGYFRSFNKSAMKNPKVSTAAYKTLPEEEEELRSKLRMKDLFK